MPRLDGIEALKEIRADARFKNLPVIVNSGDSGIEKAVLELGAVYFPKGHHKELLKLIDKTLRAPEEN
jgi:CheY-like chemotaxis protein